MHHDIYLQKDKLIKLIGSYPVYRNRIFFFLIKLNSRKILFYKTIFLGIIITISSNNWVIIWCGLEISLISIIPLIISKLVLSSESTIKYFIVQRISSSILMLGVLIIIIRGDYNYDYLLVSSLLIKIGVAPFHNWLLTVIEGLNFSIVVIILTINKIAPLFMLSYIRGSIVLVICITILLGSILGLNQNSIKKLIGYSSIFNIGFILSVIKFNLIWIYYLIVYSILMVILILLIKMKSIHLVNQLIFSRSIVISISIWINLLSMAGIPPLIGFSVKYMVIICIIKIKLNFIIFIILITSLLVMFFYLRLRFISSINNFIMLKIKLFNLKEISVWILLINVTTLPFMLIVKTCL